MIASCFLFIICFWCGLSFFVVFVVSFCLLVVGGYRLLIVGCLFFCDFCRLLFACCCVVCVVCRLFVGDRCWFWLLLVVWCV